MNAWSQRISIDPKVLTGKPVVKGTRLSVDFLLDLMAEGWTDQQILENYPGLTEEDLSACLSYASNVLKTERVFPTPA